MEESILHQCCLTDATKMETSYSKGLCKYKKSNNQTDLDRIDITHTPTPKSKKILRYYTCIASALNGKLIEKFQPGKAYKKLHFVFV